MRAKSENTFFGIPPRAAKDTERRCRFFVSSGFGFLFLGGDLHTADEFAPWVNIDGSRGDRAFKNPFFVNGQSAVDKEVGAEDTVDRNTLGVYGKRAGDMRFLGNFNVMSR